MRARRVGVRGRVSISDVVLVAPERFAGEPALGEPGLYDKNHRTWPQGGGSGRSGGLWRFVTKNAGRRRARLVEEE